MDHGFYVGWVDLLEVRQSVVNHLQKLSFLFYILSLLCMVKLFLNLTSHFSLYHTFDKDKG